MTGPLDDEDFIKELARLSVGPRPPDDDDDDEEEKEDEWELELASEEARIRSVWYKDEAAAEFAALKRVKGVNRASELWDFWSRLPADIQAGRVYRWEHSVEPPRRRMPMRECRELVDRIWRNQGRRDPPKVTLVKAKPGKRPTCIAEYDESSWVHDAIVLTRSGQNAWTVCHEAAHALLTEDVVEAHGPEFVRLLIGLAARNAGHRERRLLKSARKSWLEVAHWREVDALLKAHADSTGD